MHFDYSAERVISAPCAHACQHLIPYLESPTPSGRPAEPAEFTSQQLENGIWEVTAQTESELTVYHLTRLPKNQTLLQGKAILPLDHEKSLEENQLLAEISFQFWAANFETFCKNHELRAL